MRKWSLVSLVVLLAVQANDRIAAAQPGADASDPAPYPPPPPDPQPQPQPQPQPPPQPYVQPYQPPPGYAPNGFVSVQLTPDEHELLQKGEITEGAHIGGVAASLLLGVGIGQAVQGRYMETGWIFTVGELASMTALIIGIGQSLDDTFVDGRDTGRGDGLIIGGLVGLAVFRVWEVVDAFTGPPRHNRKVRDLKMRLGMPVPMYTHRVMPYVNRTRDSGATAGVVFRF